MKKNSTIYSIIGIILNLIIGVNFLFSAYAKLPSIEVFGWTIAESTPFNWTIAEWLARLIIGLEIFLGVIFVLQLFVKKIAIPSSALLLGVFSLYLVYILSVYGNEPNCGCYGEMLPLSTTESLIKNAVLFVLVLLAFKFSFELKFRFYKWLGLLFLAGSFTLPIFLSPPSSIIIFNKDTVKNEVVPMHIISGKNNYEPSRKKILAMVSPTCKYCKKAAKRMGIIKKRNPQVPLQLVMGGHRDHLPTFLEETRADNIPLVFLDSFEDFKLMNARNGVPTIKWVEDSTVVKTSTYFSLNENEILEWLKK